MENYLVIWGKSRNFASSKQNNITEQLKTIITIMTNNELFKVLHTFLTTASRNNEMATWRAVFDEISKLPKETEIFIVSNENTELSFASFMQAMREFRSCNDWTEIYCLDTMGGIRTIKTR